VKRPKLKAGDGSRYGEPIDLQIARVTAPWGGVVGATHRGLRRENNEDAFGISPDAQVFAVADGMGGHAAGEVASREAIAGVLQAPPVAALRARAQRCLRAAQARVIAAAGDARGRDRPGTTLVVATLDPALRSFSIGWCGDSRAYTFDGEKLDAITTDHAYGPHMLLRCLGSETHRDDPGQYLGPLVLDEGAWIVLCSDGLHGYVSEARIVESLRAATDREDALRRLFAWACLGGAPDNVTVLLARIGACP